MTQDSFKETEWFKTPSPTIRGLPDNFTAQR